MKMAAEAIRPDDSSNRKSNTGFWQRRLIQPIRTQLTQGVTPEALSWAIAGGFLTGIFPILGTTTVVCLLAGIVFRLNQPVLQTIKLLVYPLQLLLIPFFIRAGEKIVGADPTPFSIPKMLELFAQSPAQFFSEFGITCVHAIVAWCVIAPVIACAIVVVTRPILRAAAKRWFKSSPPEAK